MSRAMMDIDDRTIVRFMFGSDLRNRGVRPVNHAQDARATKETIVRRARLRPGFQVQLRVYCGRVDWRIRSSAVLHPELGVDARANSAGPRRCRTGRDKTRRAADALVRSLYAQRSTSWWECRPAQLPARPTPPIDDKDAMPESAAPPAPHNASGARQVLAP